MSHNNNNNNGSLHVRVRATEDIEPFLQLTCLVVECESQQQFGLITGPHRRFWFPCTSHFHLLLVVFGFSVYCLFTERKLNVHAQCLLRFWWMSSATYRPGIWTSAFSVIFSGSVWTQIFLKRWRGRRRKKRDRFRPCGRGLRPIGGAWHLLKTKKKTRSMHIKLACCKQTTRRRWKWLVQRNQNLLCGPVMRSNCCCDSHSTTRHVSCKKGSISSVARTRTCRLPLLLLLLWDIAGSEVRG